MRTLLASFALAALTATAAIAQPPSAPLTLTFEGLEPRGRVMVAVFDSEAAYNGQGAPVRQLQITAGAPSVTELVAGLAPGRYAVKAFHDVNGDGAMGSNPFGIPTEPFAFSNNARGQMGPAAWSAAAFDLGASGAVQVVSFR